MTKTDFHARFTKDDLISATSEQAPQWVNTPVNPLKQPVRVWTDTRTLQDGDFFLPLTGDHFDGHDYLAQAFEKGASGAFVAKHLLKNHPEWGVFPDLIAVSDPLEAYLSLGRFHRRRVGVTLIGLTGSSGKTTTKELMHAAFSPLTPTQSTRKNDNNEVGVSQTLLSIRPETRLVIVEMAMRGPGEIRLLSHYAEPDIAVVINVGPAHIGRLGSLEKIAQAKCELFEGLDPGKGIAVVNGDDALLTQTTQTCWKGALETYTLSDASAITEDFQDGISFDYRDTYRIRLALPGMHMVSNALAVLKVGELLGYSADQLKKGLQTCGSAEGRWQKTAVEGLINVLTINDAYNANPASMQASLDAFLGMAFPGMKRILVIGGMKELGDQSRNYHTALGYWLGRQSVDLLITVGSEGEWVATEAMKSATYPIHHLDNLYTDTGDSPLPAVLKTHGLPLRDVAIFLKGSRVYRLEQMIPGLIPEQFPEQAQVSHPCS